MKNKDPMILLFILYHETANRIVGYTVDQLRTDLPCAYEIDIILCNTWCNGLIPF